MVERKADLGGRTPEDLARLDAAHVWHPFTPMRQYAGTRAPVIVRGEGVRIQDAEGRWYFDGTSAIWLNVHGHRVPEIDAAINDQLGRIAHSTLLGQANVPSILLAERLVELAPSGLDRVFYTDNGAGAVEAAIKMAVQFWANQGIDRRFVLGFTDNYHGDTLGAVGVATDDLFHAPFLGLLPGHPRVPYPKRFRAADSDSALQNSLDAADRTLRERDDIAAVIVEPVQGAAGIIPSPPGFLKGLRALCDEHDVLLIVDEVATGFGRTGTMFACDPEGIAPDLLCIGKGLTGGYLPVAATLATDRVFDAFLGEIDEARTFFHGHSYTGNPLGCAAALANLGLLESLLPQLPGKVELLAAELEPLTEHPFVGDIRQAGFMTGIELVRDRATGEGFAYRERAAWLVTDAARERGLLVRPIGNVVIFMPPLGSTPDELTEMTTILREAFAAATPALEELVSG
ncbi:MAG: adenosylmethionine--8-amino-7-oxononanoate transaminase [Actinomycetota bacterium]